MMKKENLIQASLAIIAIAGFILGIYFIVRLVNSPDRQKAAEQSADETISSTTKTYTHPGYGFSFDYPDNFTLGNFPEDAGETILVQGADGKNGFQIFISSYNEPEELSLAVIEKSAEGLTIKDGKEVAIGKDNLRAFSFTLENPEADAGDPTAATNETWFVQGENLYQITSYEDFADKMGKILESWKFN